MNMMTSLPMAAFNYAGLPADLADRQRERAERIVALQHRTIEAMGEIGRELLEAQAELEHGAFLDWIRDATGLSKSSAYRFMDMARTFGPKLPTVGSLPLAVVHKLAEKSTPEPIRAAVLRRIEAGENVKAEVVLGELREAKEAARAAAAAQQEAAAAEREAARRGALSEEERNEEDALKARGARGKAARERKRQHQLAAYEEERRQHDAEVLAAARALIDMIGVDLASNFFGRFKGVRFDLWRAAEEELQRRLDTARLTTSQSEEMQP
jgi:hypothetical protein